MGMPLSEVERMDLNDIRQLNAVLDMRRDHDSAADAWQAENVKKSQKERTSGNCGTIHSSRVQGRPEGH